MSQVQIHLEIDTGAGNTALAGNCGTTSDLFFPLWDIALGTVVDKYHGRQASDILGDLDRAIESLQWDRNAYSGLTTAQQTARPQAEAYLVVWRDLCRKHPNCRITINP
jgi:hypothetical protein